MRILGLAMLAAMLVSGCQDQATESGDQTIRIVMMRYLSFAPLFVALDEGFFEDEGLTVETVTVARSDAAIPPLIQGQVDVVPAAIMPSYFNVIFRGEPMRIVAGKGSHRTDACAYSGIMVRSSLLENGEVTEVADMAGRSAGIEPSSPSYYRFFKFLEAGGLVLDDVKRVNLPMPSKIEAFREGVLDATTASEPWVSVIEEQGHAHLWITSKELLPDYQFGQILFGRNLLEDRPEAGRKFMVAYLRAVRQLNREGKTERHIDILARHTKLDRELLRQACWPPVRDDARVHLESLRQFQQWAFGEGLVDQLIEPEELVDDRFIEYANQELDRREAASP